MLHRYIGLLVLLVFTFSSLPSQAASPNSLKMELTLAESEFGNSASTVTTKITLKGHILSYEWSYTGYHPDRNFPRHMTKSAKLSSAQVDFIRQIITQNHLDTPYNDSTAPATSGHHRLATFTLIQNKQKISSTLAGKGQAKIAIQGIEDIIDFIEETVVA